MLEQAIDLEDRLGGARLRLRFAALMHDIGKPQTRRFEDAGRVTFHHHDVVGAKLDAKRMLALRFPSDDDRRRHHSWSSCTCASTDTATGEWTDSAVRRYVRDAGDQLERLHMLTRADCTTRNRRKAAAAARPTTTSRSGSRGWRARRSWPRSAPTWTAPDHGDPRHPARAVRSARPTVPARPAPRPRPLGDARRGPRCSPGGPTAPGRCRGSEQAPGRLPQPVEAPDRASAGPGSRGRPTTVWGSLWRGRLLVGAHC